jgi:Na+/proline symporter
MLAALIGFGGFVLTVTLISVVAYRNADSLEHFAKKHLRSHKPAN